MRKKINRKDIALFIGIVMMTIIALIISLYFIFPVIIEPILYSIMNGSEEVKKTVELVKALFSPFKELQFNIIWILLCGTIMGVGFWNYLNYPDNKEKKNKKRIT